MTQRSPKIAASFEIAALSPLPTLLADSLVPSNRSYIASPLVSAIFFRHECLYFDAMTFQTARDWLIIFSILSH